ncbi:MAG: GNAT family N-acetyltransferase [Deltaproteobacteria bacterium]|nr:GNAT family N-acetyltransferase [Deltaproteobacteria bacterium]
MRASADRRGRADALWRLERAAFVAGARPHALPGGELYLHPEVPEVWDASFVANLRFPLDVDRLLEAAAHGFSLAGCGHHKLWVRQADAFPTFGRRLVERGFSERRMVIMSAPTEALPPRRPPPAGLRIEPVRDSADRRDLAFAREGCRRDAPWFGPEVCRALDRWEDVQARTLGLQWLVAYLEDEPVGAVGLLETEDGASLQSLATVSHLRRQGIGQALIAKVRWLARSRGHATLSLLTDLDSDPQALYHRLGFLDTLEVRSYQRAI